MCNVLETASILILSESGYFWISVVKWFNGYSNKFNIQTHNHM